MCALCQLPVTHQVELQYAANFFGNPRMILNYIDPGSGYVLGSSLPALLAAILGALASALFFLRHKIFPFFNKKLIIVLIFIVLFAAGIMWGMANSGVVNSKKVVILGFDGMDPNILEQGWKNGRFPNLKKLKETGYFSRLSTTIPPQSPVAWAGFITGENPSKHGVYDFIERDPATYSLNLVFSQENNKKEYLKATPFWDITTKNKIPSTVLFLPDTFEPPKALTGEMISGMGVPDLLGTQGTFTLFTTKSYPTSDYTWRGNVIQVANSKSITAMIKGPKYNSGTDTKVATIPLATRIINDKSIEITVQKQTFTLNKGEFSEWKRLEFGIDIFTKVKGIVKFYLKSTAPDFELYMSPINFDPESPLKPISLPKSFSAKLSKDLGMYSTLGLPHDTWALEENVFDEKAFLKQADSILSERKKIYYSKLHSYNNGILFAYFGMPDTISHMFWRYLSDLNSPYHDTISSYYDKMDEIVGETLNTIDKNTTLLILSDHGFSSFDYEMNVNTFLMKEGYLVLKEGEVGSGPLFDAVDWSRTRAYAAGYNSVYFNIKGREAEGIVDPRDIPQLHKEIISKLMEVGNPFTSDKIMKHVYTRNEMGVVASDSNAPDLILGFYKGTRSSWDSAIGAVTSDVIKKRTYKWSGDHLFDPTEVPGVLLSNKKLGFKDPKITQIMSEVFKILGISN